MKNKKFNKQSNKNIIIIIAVVVGVLLLWGLIGGNEVQSIGKTCDFGLGETFCWKWHTNALGQVGENIKDFLN
jgi:hypothetical protein